LEFNGSEGNVILEFLQVGNVSKRKIVKQMKKRKLETDEKKEYCKTDLKKSRKNSSSEELV
jgi:hypothetical protein